MVKALLSAQTKNMEVQLGFLQSAVGKVHPHSESTRIQFGLQIDETEDFFVRHIALMKDLSLLQSDQLPFPEKQTLYLRKNPFPLLRLTDLTVILDAYLAKPGCRSERRN